MNQFCCMIVFFCFSFQTYVLGIEAIKILICKVSLIEFLFWKRNLISNERNVNKEVLSSRRLFILMVLFIITNDFIHV
jgi:hypothetical protein